ncbi:urease accessory protein UreD [Salinisphaera sp. SPP-AMP-43]|uniref:urease accessory protein UreD n=1 Tax=Salinisphaera sp. SPP-AMP-43 TaxID=3121288 RepID=UPI003C6E38AC
MKLDVERRGSRSAVTRRQHVGPVYIQRPLYPEPDGTAHIMLLHPPGGVVQGDEIVFDIAVGREARALVTTPSAAKLYRSPDRASSQRVSLTVGAGAEAEWLPQETIVFDGAQGRTALDVDLAADARLIAWEVWMLGRPAAGEAFDHGVYDGRLRVCIDGRLCWHERTYVPGRQDSRFQDAPWGLAGARAVGTLIAYHPQGFDEDQVAGVRQQLADSGIVHGVTRVENLMIVRTMGAEPRFLLAPMRLVWQWLRPRIFDKPAIAPRIWAT